MTDENEKQENADAKRDLETWIFARIQQRCNGEHTDSRDPDLEDAIYRFLYRELRGVAAALPGLGPGSLNRNVDHSARFTAVLNKAFLRILERYPDRLLRAKARHQLTGYVSRTMSNMMLNHYNRRSRYQEILEDVRHQQPEDVVSEQLIAGLTEDRGDYFVERTGVDFAEGLRLLGEWEASSEIELRDRAAAMRYRYIDGFGYDQIAQQMRIGRGEVENLLERAKYHLRKRDQR